MGRTYNLLFENITVAGATSVAMLRPGTTCSIRIVRAWIAQRANATSAQVGIHLTTQAAALPTTMVSATPVAVDRAGQASAIVGGTNAGTAGTCGINIGTEGGGTRTPLVVDAFNSLNGWLWVPGPRDEIILPASHASAFAMWLPTAPGTLTGWCGGFTFQEV
jgi:hypothetical protein